MTVQDLSCHTALDPVLDLVLILCPTLSPHTAEGLLLFVFSLPILRLCKRKLSVLLVLLVMALIWVPLSYRHGC